ncbi:type II secretion system minor pseudopilin GspK [Reinekea sp.]|jgi:general secretion pathway protein K|uniref:type II secretion system minor pseudopilin GspK n=1 Tax=Reinekea sp. TaxID=1970455 RepID=UPI002A80E095|nr:type II secretion system minor pseudopilin GspK [Reinekea sp.]
MIRQQNGFVLIQVMLVFAILIVVAAKLQYEQRIQIDRTAQSLFLSQAQTYAESAEAIAKVGLMLDLRSSQTDHLYEVWNTSEGLFPIDDGLIQLELNDLEGRFNVNWLTAESGYRESAQQSLSRLLTILGSKPEIADELFQWFDSDSGIDYLYADELPSYAPAYRAMGDISELLLLKSVDYAEFNNIAPYLSALPADTKLNINTAPAEIIQSIAVYIDESSAQQVVVNRGETGFTSLSDFLNAEVFKQNEDSSVLLAQLSVTSNWFELYTAVTLQERTLTQRSTLHRGPTGITLTLRDRSVQEANPIPGDPIKGLPPAANNNDANDANESNIENGA